MLCVTAASQNQLLWELIKHLMVQVLPCFHILH